MTLSFFDLSSFAALSRFLLDTYGRAFSPSSHHHHFFLPSHHHVKLGFTFLQKRIKRSASCQFHCPGDSVRQLLRLILEICRRPSHPGNRLFTMLRSTSARFLKCGWGGCVRVGLVRRCGITNLVFEVFLRSLGFSFSGSEQRSIEIF